MSNQYSDKSFAELDDMVWEAMQTKNGSGRSIVTMSVVDDDLLLAYVDSAPSWDDSYVPQAIERLCYVYDVNANEYETPDEVFAAIVKAAE